MLGLPNRSEVDNMKKIETLAETGTASVAIVIPEVWSRKVEEAARPKRVFRNLISLNTDLLNKEGDIVWMPRRGTVTAAGLTEAGTITPTALTYGTALKLEPSEVGAGVSVSKQAVERAFVNLLEDATRELGEALAQKEDLDIGTALTAATTNALYGGNATGTADIESGDVLTPTLFAKAILYVRDDNFNPTDIVIAPEQQWQLGTASQFTNAATFGGRELITTGYVPQYLGVKIWTSTNVPSGAAGAGTDVPYHVCVVMDSKRAGAIAVKRNPTIETKYEPLERKHKIAATMEYAVGLLNDAAVCTITVSDS